MIIKIINFFLDIYLKIFSFKFFMPLYKFLIHLSLKASGYKNFGNFQITGESFFLKKIKKYKIRNSIDIGANTGEYSKKLILITNSNVFAFEAMQGSFKKLKLLEKKFSGKLKCFNIALSNKIEKKNIYFQNQTSQLASFEINIRKLNYVTKKIKKKKIQLITLDKFIAGNKKLFKKGIDFIKVDTEGLDYKVLLGSLKTIKKYKPKFIQFEMNWHYLFSGINLFKFSQTFNSYKIYRILPYRLGIISVNPMHPDNNYFHLSNFVLVRKDIKI